MGLAERDDQDSYEDSDTDLMENKTELFYAKGEDGTGTFAGSVANMINSAIGAGVLGLPFAFQAAGTVLGCIFCFFFGSIILYSLHVVGRAQKMTNSATYQEAVYKFLGRKAEIGVIILQLMFLIGACIGFLDIIPDQLVPVMSHWTSSDSIVANREFIICVLAACPILPLMFVQNIQKLWPLATFSVIAITYCLGMIMARSIPEMGKPHNCMGEAKPYPGDEVSYFRASVSIIKAVPIFCFAFNIHTTYPLVFAEMDAPKSLTRMDKAAGFSLFACAIVYVLCGVCGYYYGVAQKYSDPGNTDPSKVGIIPGDALKMFPDGPIDVILARFCIAISVVGSFTTLHFSARICLQDLVVKGQEGGFTPRQRIYEIFIYLLCTVGVSMVLKELDFVLDLVGSVAIIPFMFVYPGMLAIQMDGNNKECFSLKGKYNGYIMIILGVVLSIAGLAVTLSEVV